jgi:hypothetical protein
VVLKLGPQFLLFGDQFVDLGENAGVRVHPTSLPDYRVKGGH